MELIGRIEISPGCWVTLAHDLIWRGSVDAELLARINRRFKPVVGGPADGWPGYREVAAAAKFFGVPYETFEPPELPVGCVY